MLDIAGKFAYSLAMFDKNLLTIKIKRVVNVARFVTAVAEGDSINFIQK